MASRGKWRRISMNGRNSNGYLQEKEELVEGDRLTNQSMVLG